MSVNRFLSLENEEVVIPEDGIIIPDDTNEPSFSDATTTLLVESGGSEGAAEMVEHAEKAREIADGLEELAEKAEELAEADVDHAVQAASLEGLQREFKAWMRSNRLDYTTESLEGQHDAVQGLRQLAKDSRRVSAHARNHYNEVLDVSTEGALMQFFRADVNNLNEAVNGLQRAVGTFTLRKENAKHGAILYHASFSRILMRRGKGVTDIKSEILSDVKWINKNVASIDSLYSDIIRASEGNGEVPELDPKKFMTEKGGLLGNRTVTEDLKYKNDSPFNKEILKGSAMLGVGLVGIGIGAGVTPLTAIAAGAYVSTAVYNLAKGASHKTSVLSYSDVIDIAKQIIDLRDINGKLAKFDTSKLDANMKVLKSSDKERHDKIKEVVGKLHKLIDVNYEHARLLVLSMSMMLDHTSSIIEAGHQEGVNE